MIIGELKNEFALADKLHRQYKMSGHTNMAAKEAWKEAKIKVRKAVRLDFFIRERHKSLNLANNLWCSKPVFWKKVSKFSRIMVKTVFERIQK